MICDNAQSEMKTARIVINHCSVTKSHLDATANDEKA